MMLIQLRDMKEIFILHNLKILQVLYQIIMILIINYIGHGNPELWAHEVVFDRNTSLPQFKNENRYFFLVAATCSFGYFDIPNFRSASEDILLLENAGSIASLTASRVVYSAPNARYSYGFYAELLAPRDSAGLSIPIGK